MKEKISVVGDRPGNRTWPERSYTIKLVPPLKAEGMAHRAGDWIPKFGRVPT